MESPKPRAAKGNFEGEKGLEAVFKSSSHKTAEEIMQAILDEVSVFVNAVTAEVASSSLVVLAILSERVALISLQPTRVQKGAFLQPFCTPFPQLEPTSGAQQFKI